MRSVGSIKRQIKGFIVVSIICSALFFPLAILTTNANSSDPWWNLDWTCRRPVTINHSMVTTDLQNFPVLIDINDAGLIGKVRSDAADVVFVDINNNTLEREIESYDSANGHLTAWVKIPLLSSMQDALLYMYYNNPEWSDQPAASAVWDSDFVMVQHLDEQSQVRLDSTSNCNNGTVRGAVTKTQDGQIGVADVFNGVSGYVNFSSGSLPTSAITLEFWFKPLSYLSSYPKFINTGPSTTGGIAAGQTYKQGSGHTDTWYFNLIFDSGTKIFQIKDFKSNYVWNHVVLTWDGAYASIFINGALTKQGAITGSPDWMGKRLYLGSNYYGGEVFNGMFDEVRLSDHARSAGWIQASYKTEKYPNQFSFIGDEEKGPTGTTPSGPLISNEIPTNGSTGLYTNPTLSARVNDENNFPMNVTFKERISGVWTTIKTHKNVPDGVYSAVPSGMGDLGTLYYWRVDVTNGEKSTSKTFSLTTTTRILVQKWTSPGVPGGVTGVLTYDVNGDGKEEVIMAGSGGMVALNADNGGVIWSLSDSNIGDHAQPTMSDLNKDGTMEIVVLRQRPAGALAVFANNGTIYWNVTGLGSETYLGIVVLDIDGDGYPTVFVASTDTGRGVNGTGRITALSYKGKILYQTFAWRPCSGGLSIADTDGDGEFELYMGDRFEYLSGDIYSDNDYGKGLQSYFASNLTLRWYRPDIFCSSQKPMIADVNKDGKQEVVIGDLTGGVVILNATDGSAIRMGTGWGWTLPTHYQPTLYDIDGDGNLEFMTTDGSPEPVGNDTVIFDLVTWKVEKRWFLGKSLYGPRPADITGDGVMDIIAANVTSIFVYDRNYSLLQQIDGLRKTLNYAVVQDIDGDGYNEMLISTSGGRVYAYDTPARATTPRPRSEIQFYSEYRLGAAEYVPPPGDPAPVISSPTPANHAKNIQTPDAELSFNAVDYQKNPINIIVTRPDGTTTKLLDKTNGRYTIPVTDLAYSTVYIWTVTATDGTHSTTKTYTFTTHELQPWWDGQWTYRKPITIDHTQVTANLQNFPVLIDVTDQGLANHAQNNGNDIAFADLAGTQLAHEIEYFDHNTGHLIAWINIPQISARTNTMFYMYYGNSQASNQQDPTRVWDSNYVMVQHLEENSGTRYDSTANGNNAATYSTITKASIGQIDGADNFNGNSYEKVTAGFLPTSAITIEMWIKPNSYSTSSYTKFINTGPTTGSGIYGSQANKISETWTWGLSWDSKNKSFTSPSFSTGNTWQHLAITWTGTYAYAYLNGQKVRESAVTGTPDWTNKPLFLGANYQAGEYFRGAIDEIRISNVARSRDWIGTSENNQKNPSSFLTFGYEETVPEAPIVSSPSPPDEQLNVSRNLAQLSFVLTDCQNNYMSYTVTTYPDIINDPVTGANVRNGKITIDIKSALSYDTNYVWTVNVTDGTHWTKVTYVFTITPSNPPTQATPTLISASGSSITCNNQSTYDSDGDAVTNMYHWLKNGVSTTNLQLSFDTNTSQIKDYSGYGNTATATQGVTWVNNGIVGGAYDFTRGFIQVPGSNILDGGGDWTELTVEHWIYLTTSQTSSGTRTIARVPSYEIRIKGTTLYAVVWVMTGNASLSGYTEVKYNTPLNLKTWYHVVLTYKNGTGLTLYINGAAVGTSKPPVWGKIQTSGAVPLYIGWFDYFKGMIDEVRIYPECLSQAQINQRYMETKDGLSSSSKIVSQELQNGETWMCEVTPSDSRIDGQTKTSNTMTIGQNNPLIIESVRTTTEAIMNQGILTTAAKSINKSRDTRLPKSL